MLIASLLMIRDVYTLILRMMAQAVCVLLGFAVECAVENVVSTISKISDFSERKIGAGDGVTQR